ncbi:hypothetical protein [Microbacterium sp. gxy059]|uniref:hypothetical protein n=1 Tax=Microbacterium sp. gxy059 TaxID=2957199 RepID=UPI003D9572A8
MISSRPVDALLPRDGEATSGRARAARILAAAATASLAVALSACGADDASPAPEDTSSPEERAELTCDTMLPETFVASLRDLDWDVRAETFRIGEHEFEEGLQCIWGDDSSGTDVAQMYGWAPVDEQTSTEMQQYLLDQGWLQEEGEDGSVILTEDPEYALYVSEDGYGMTYEFADGWVALADTKSGLDLVIWGR